MSTQLAGEGTGGVSVVTDGGPAFPQSEAWGSKYPVPGGMSLRDYFAAQALVGLLAEAAHPDSIGWNPRKYDLLAKEAYRLADEMLKARGEWA